jgi:hypothetical protein
MEELNELKKANDELLKAFQDMIEVIKNTHEKQWEAIEETILALKNYTNGRTTKRTPTHQR